MVYEIRRYHSEPRSMSDIRILQQLPSPAFAPPKAPASNWTAGRRRELACSRITPVYLPASKEKKREPDAPASKSIELTAGRSRSAPFPFPRRHPRSLHY